LARTLHPLSLGPEYVQFSLNALVYRQINSSTFASAVDRKSHPVEALFQNLDTHLNIRLIVEKYSITMSHVGAELRDLQSIQRSLAPVEKGAIDPIAQSATLAREY
jgi:hypothetical protein